MRYNITPTPSNTPSNTPSYTPSGTACPTPTPSVTSTQEPICPEQLILTQTSPTILSAYTGTYDRLYSWSGGSFNYVFRSNTLGWVFDTPDNNGFYSVAYGRFDGTNYQTIFVNVVSVLSLIQIYGINSRTDNYIIGLAPNSPIYFLDTTLATVGNVKYPIGAGSNNFYIAYPELCPTPTQTASPTLTPGFTQTPSATPTLTPTPSPTTCYNPQAYILFDTQSGSTALNSWMSSQGSSFRGMFINGPSTNVSIFPSQMNAYISYSGFGINTFALFNTSISLNQDPITWLYGPDFNTNTWVNMLVPSCPICAGGEYTLMGNQLTPVYTTNDTYRSIEFYYSGTAIPQGYYRLYTTYSDTAMRLNTSSNEYSLGSLVCPATPTPTATSTVTPTRTPTQTQTPSQTGTIPVTPTNTQTPSVTPTNTPTGTVEATPTQTQTNTPSVTATSTPTGTLQSTPTMTPTPSPTPVCDCLCFSTTYETLSEGLQVRWRDCETDTITTQDISSLLTRDNNDGTYTTFICVKQGLSYATPVCVLDGLEVTCDPLTWIENGPCCDSLDCDIPCLCINIETNISLDIIIDQVIVDGNIATVAGGVMPNEPGNGTNLCVYIPAGTYTVQIDYSCSVSGQKISILDSNSLNQCNPTSTGPNTMTFYNVVMNNGQCTTISPADGAC